MNFKRKVLLIAAGATMLLANTQVKAQEANEKTLDTLSRNVQNMSDDLNKMKRLKISGYIQPQFQVIDSAGAPSVAGGDFMNSTKENGVTTASPYNNRFTIRRGRFKFTYDYKNVRFMINTDITEKGVAMRESYVKINDNKKIFSLTAGLLQDQFGFEVTQSSGERETPERARYNQTLFPTERDLGVFGTIVFPNSSKLYGLKIDVAAMNGSAGVSPEFDSYKDFTGRVQYSKTSKSENLSYAVGASTYQGGYRIGSVKDYNMGKLANENNGFVYASDTANYNRKAERIYYGADAQVSIDWKAGITTLRAEYIQGEQPGSEKTSKSAGGPPGSAAYSAKAIYQRNFNGAYFYFIQDIGHTKFQVVAKYDWYDPNTKLSGKEIGSAANATLADIRFDTYGFGLNYYMNTHVKVMMYYDLVKNESTLVKGYSEDIRDNVMTVRMQYKF